MFLHKKKNPQSVCKSRALPISFSVSVWDMNGPENSSGTIKQYKYLHFKRIYGHIGECIS